MQKVRFSISIQAPVDTVYRNMLGLDQKSTYEFWTSAFNPTSTYEGSWDQGSKIYFVGTDENGIKRGMVSEIAENRPAEYVSIRHYGFLEGDKEITTGEQVEKWAGGRENYLFISSAEGTTVTVEMDTIEEYQDYFNQAYPKALAKLKEISEK